MVFRKNLILLLAQGVALGALSSCSDGPDVETVAGPETPGLAEEVKGMLVIDRPLGGLVALSLPEKEERVIRAAGQSPGTVHSVSGPDREGRVAMIEDHMGDRHLLKVYRSSGEFLKTVFERRGGALWGDEIGDSLALSPVNGYVAAVVDLSDVQMRRPGALLNRGVLAIWRIEDGERLTVSHRALDDRLAWFPDGKRLAFVALSAAGRPADGDGDAERSADTGGHLDFPWDAKPRIMVMNVETGDIRRIGVGWRPVVSVDGREIVAGDWDNNWAVYSSDGAFVKSIEPAGMTRLGAIHFDERRVLYWGLPTEGSELRMTKHNSPVVGPKPMYTLKLWERGSGAFETVVPYIDPRTDVSFGVAP